ncbi:Rnase H [Gordonia phage Powerball]|uniref:DnaQ-like DNA polymerase III subunit n=1 Tax=Gordonia phage Powerball TaxID=2599847 RepID=A0A5J6TRV2_9CAUD|nr:Rnase H [Gordonia phage Powerball]QFG13491.1 DnaQ-like DNA polymerase III subunit [Gordonia phage Powerball]
MKFWYDTEFLEDGKTIELISIGIVAENEATYYAVNSEMPDDKAMGNDEWMCKNVVAHLPLATGLHRHTSGTCPHYWSLDMKSPLVKPKWVIANEVREFLTGTGNDDGTPVELWADYAAYDHVVLAQLWGKMIHLPAGIPMWTHDLRQLWEQAGRPEFPTFAFDGGPMPEHHALADARELRARWRWLQNELEGTGETTDGGDR